jgi:adenylyltransferase/sulfurtransferase
VVGRDGRGRYARQAELFGKDGQRLLRKASVLIAGAGGLGTVAAAYLAAAGVGRLRIIDRDLVEWSNLNRQIFYSGGDIGRPKARVLARRLKRLNSGLETESRTADLRSAATASLFSSADILVDGLDNFKARYVLNSASLATGRPLVHGSVRGFCGQLTIFIPGQTPCLRCLYPESPRAGRPPVAGPVCAVIGGLQAFEVIKFILGKGSLLRNRLLLFDGLRGTLEEVEVIRRPDCPDCGAAAADPGKRTT